MLLIAFKLGALSFIWMFASGFYMMANTKPFNNKNGVIVFLPLFLSIIFIVLCL